MGNFRFDRALESLASINWMVWLLWAGLALFTVAMIAAMQTRWGQSRPLRKCVALSLWVHALLIGYTTTVKLASAPPQSERDVMQISLVEGLLDQPVEPVEKEDARPWEKFVHDAVSGPEAIDPHREMPSPAPAPQREKSPEPGNLPGEPSLGDLALADPSQPEPKPSIPAEPAGGSPADGPAPEDMERPERQRREPSRPAVPEQPLPGRHIEPPEPRLRPVRIASTGGVDSLFGQSRPLPPLAAKASTPQPPDSPTELKEWSGRPGWRQPTGTDPSGAPPGGDVEVKISPEAFDRSGGTEQKTPAEYQLRTDPDRDRLAQQQGATPQSEAAVKAALKWLAANQEPDGHWDANRHGAGRELSVAGRDRQSAGIRADSGITGLALLAFLASGHTHQEGNYRETVRLGLQYLLRIQAGDGNLAAAATPFAKMYCHSMASFALGEAYAMTDDHRLRDPLRRAVNYIVAVQDPSGGGFRYQAGDPGDTSLCGWQWMALKSAKLAGVPVPKRSRDGIMRYLKSVASGKHWGLASYRPGEPASRPMTAEALVCWQFLGMPRTDPAGDEAGDYLLGELPGEGKENLYYWYYGTLATYQLQGTHWQRWNEAMKKTLVESQRKTGSLAGTWDPDTVWGAYGGRVYSTAMATLCLEVYYRFLPLYQQGAAAHVAAGRR